MVPNQLYTSVC